MAHYYKPKAQPYDVSLAPDSRSVEIQVLADLTESPELIPTARGIINAEMFTDTNAKAAWRVLVSMCENGETIDLTTLSNRVDGALLVEVMQAQTYAGPQAAIAHFGALREAATRRKMYLAAYEMMKAAATKGTDIQSLIAMPGELASTIAADMGADASTKSIADAMNDLAESLQANAANEASGKRTRVPTGFSLLDAYTYNGFNEGNLVILAARPSVGKTAVMLQMALAASRAGTPAMIFSLEMTEKELCQRLLLSTEKVKPRSFADNSLDWQAFESAVGDVVGPICINDNGQGIDDICNLVTMEHQRGRCGIAFIDYLGLIQSRDQRKTTYQVVTENTARLKRLAKSAHIPIVLLCQLNRASDNENRPPSLHDLRDSGSIEQDADIVLMLERGSRDLSDHRLKMWVRKNRQGKAGDVYFELYANDTFTRFSE